MLGHAGLPGTAATPVIVPNVPPIFAGGPVIGALALNVTVTDSEDPAVGGGYVTVFPCGTRPEASNLNFVAGQTIANAVIAPVSATGRICFYVYGTANLLADVSGYFPTPNTVGFKFVDQSGIPILGAGLLWCNRTADPACPQAFFIGSDAAGIARLALDPGASYTITAHVGDTGWPCPGFIDPFGHTSHFGVPVQGLGASFANLTTLTIVKPDPSAC